MFNLSCFSLVFYFRNGTNRQPRYAFHEQKKWNRFQMRLHLSNFVARTRLNVNFYAIETIFSPRIMKFFSLIIETKLHSSMHTYSRERSNIAKIWNLYGSRFFVRVVSMNRWDSYDWNEYKHDNVWIIFDNTRLKFFLKTIRTTQN